MQILRCSRNVQLPVDNSPQTHTNCRQFRCEHLRIANNRSIRFQARRFRLNERLNRLATNFFFALNQKSDIHRKLTRALNRPRYSFHQDQSLPFIIGRTASVNVVIAHGGFKCRGDPFVQRLRGLNIVMAVK